MEKLNPLKYYNENARKQAEKKLKGAMGAYLTYIKALQIPAGSNVLDVCGGDGTGYFTGGPNDYNFTCIDGAPNALKLCEDFISATTHCIDLNQNPSNWPVNDNTFQYVACLGSIEYLKKPYEVLNTMFKKAALGGVIALTYIIADDNKTNEHGIEIIEGKHNGVKGQTRYGYSALSDKIVTNIASQHQSYPLFDKKDQGKCLSRLTFFQKLEASPK